MSRVISRPVALLEGSVEPAKLTQPDSDAESYVREGRVFEKMPGFLDLLAMLSDSRMPRLSAFNLRARGKLLIIVMGEPMPVAGKDTAIGYGFGFAPDGVTELIEVCRVAFVGQVREQEVDTQTLAWVDVSDETNPVFRTPDLRATIEDPAQIEELTQLLAIGQDEAEWALD